MSDPSSTPSLKKNGDLGSVDEKPKRARTWVKKASGGLCEGGVGQTNGGHSRPSSSFKRLRGRQAGRKTTPRSLPHNAQSTNRRGTQPRSLRQLAFPGRAP